MANRSQKTRFVKVILEGQIRGQMTGNGLKEKVLTDLRMMTLTNLVFWLRLAILVGYLLGQEGRKSVCSFFLWPVPRHLTSDLTLKDDFDNSGFLAGASHFGRLSFGAKRSQNRLVSFSSGPFPVI